MKPAFRDEYPPEILKKLQEIELEILKVVASICDQLGITWFSDSGTSIGAIRHHGFIPWDDDIDIGIPFDEYKTFVDKAPEIVPEGYGIYLPTQTEKYSPLWAKVYKKNTKFVSDLNLDAGFMGGIFVDVFPFVQLDSNKDLAQKQIRSMANWQRVSYLYHSSNLKISNTGIARLLAKIAFICGHGFLQAAYTPEKIFKNFSKICESGNHEGDWCCASYPLSGIYTTEELFPVSSCPFEDMVIPTPHDAHAVLTKQYGNFMQLPPEEKRKNTPVRILDFGNGVNVLE